MIKHKFEVKVNGKNVFQKEDHAWPTYWEAKTKIESELYQAIASKIQAAKPGQGGSMNITVSWENTFNGRAPRRAPDVIAAEKAAKAAAKAAKAQTTGAWKEKYRQESDQRTINLRNRIKQQVDHAFALGKHGTESAAKYITCQHCDGPATVVYLDQPLIRGAAVLDEDTIVGASCAPHINNSVYGYYSSHNNKNVTKVPTDKLEFFYDGIRQIAVKAA